MKPLKSAPYAPVVKPSDTPGRPLAVGGFCAARQPIFTCDGDVAGYELLCPRAPTEAPSGNAFRGAKTADAVGRTYLDLDLDELTSGRPAFIGFTREMLLAGTYMLMPRNSVVVQLLADVKPDDAVEHACEDLADAGYTLALDGFAWSPSYRYLLELASIVKVDARSQSPVRLDATAQRLAPYDVRLLAAHVETAEVRATCAGLGYELFEGSYYMRPQMVMNRATLKSEEMTMVRAMNVLRDDRATDADARAVFCADLGLSHKLLRMVSLAAREAAGADSARHATQRTGRTELRKWLALLLVSSIAARGGGSRELVQRAVQRGRMCELLAGRTAHHCDSGSHFLVGLFSLLDALSGMPMPELLDVMELAPALREALVLRAGPYAPALVLVEAYEQAAWETVAQLARLSGRSAADVGSCYVQSLAWTRRRLLSLAAA